MANEELKLAAQKELMRRKAKAEIARRQELRGAGAVAQQAPTVGGKPFTVAPKWASYASGLQDTLSFGFGDEMNAGLDALTGQSSYDEGLDRWRRNTEVFAGDNPKTYMAGQVTGAVLPVIATMGGAAAPSVGGTVARGAGVGATQGAVYGFGSGEGGFKSRALNSAKESLKGGLLGGAFPVIAKPIGAAWNGVVSILSGAKGATKTQSTIIDMLEKSGLTPDQAAAKLDQLGPEAMLADLAQIEAAGTARASTEAGELMGGRLAQRRKAAPRRVEGLLDQNFGPAKDPFAVSEATKASKAAISPEYKAALAGASGLPKNVADAMMRGHMKIDVASMSVNNRAAMGGHVDAINDALSAANPRDAASRLLDYRKWLDNQISYDPRSIAMMSSADKAAQSVTKQARAMVDDMLEEYVPDIAAVDAKFVPIARQQEAFDYGRKKVLRGGADTVTPNELTAKMSKMTPVERDMIKQGTRTELDRALSNPRQNPATLVDRVTNRDWNDQKIEGLLGTTKAQNVSKGIEKENLFTETSNLVEPTRGSRTAVLDAAKQRWEKPDKGGLLGDMATAFAGGTTIGGPVAGTAAAVALGARRVVGSLFDGGKVNEKLIIEAADKLTASGLDRNLVVKGLLDIGKSNASKAIKKQKAEKLVTGLLGYAARGSIPVTPSPFGD